MPRQAAAGKRGQQRGDAQAKADEIATGVSHEKPRGRPVMPQKASQCAGQNQ